MGDQLSLPVIERVVDGLEIGVLPDGRAYLSGRSLATLCGVAPFAVINQEQNWRDGKRDGALAKLMVESGITRPTLQLPANKPNTYAYTDDVCSVFVLYYAAYAGPNCTEEARTALRKFNQAGLRTFLYGMLGYDPTKAITEFWKPFHDRLMLATCPPGYFSVFRESDDFVVAAMHAGLPNDEHSVPDISIGQAWSETWKLENHEQTFGPRQRHEHNFPSYYAQAASNPQKPWVYPLAALGVYKLWLQDVYIPKKFPAYLDGKVRKLQLTAGQAKALLAKVTIPVLPPTQ